MDLPSLEQLKSREDRTALATALAQLNDSGANPEYVKVAADAAASTVTAETAFHKAGSFARKIAKIEFVPSAALTANDTNFATLIVGKRSAAGGARTTLKQVTTAIAGGTGNWTAFVAVDFGVLTVSSLAAGDSITLEITKAAAGVAVPAGVLKVTYG